MEYSSRDFIETLGKLGARTKKHEDVLYASVLSHYWCAVNSDDKSICHWLIKDGYWESWITLWISQNVLPGTKVIDIGSNVGYYTFFLQKHGCKVYSVEANPELCKLLMYSAKANGCEYEVSILNFALSNYEGKCILKVPDTNHLGGSGIDNVYTGSNFTAEHHVECITLDKLLNYAVMPEIGFVKVDAEGSEFNILKGATSFIKKAQDCLWLIEWTPGKPENNDFAQFLFDNWKHIGYVDYEGKSVSIKRSKKELMDINHLSMIYLSNNKP